MWGWLLLVGASGLMYPNPLGDGCLHMQYSVLNDPEKVAVPFDISNPSVANGLDINNPPSLLSLARGVVGACFRTFVARTSRCAQAPWGDGQSWAGQCRQDVSEIRDALSVYGNIYPGAGGMYPPEMGDPWRLLQENITHEGYHLSGEFLDMFMVTYKNATTGKYINQEQREETYEELKAWWKLYQNTLGDGTKAMFLGGPTWMSFATLDGAVNSDGSVISDTNVVYTQRNMTRQFWGLGPAAKSEYGAYENMGLLMRTQFETAMNGLCGSDDCQYDRVMSFTDICRYSPGEFQGEWVPYGDHEEFHDLRKQLRSMWRTLSDYPQTLPMAWYTFAIPDTTFVLHDIPTMTYAQVNIPGKGRQLLLPMLFRNDETTRTDLKAAGWPDGLIDLALAMALGGYYKQEKDTSDAVIGTQSQWDFIQRFGYINNFFMEWKYAVDAKVAQADLDAKRERINKLWVDLKGWLVRNRLKELLHVAVDYLPWPTCDGPAGQNRTDAPTMSAAPTKENETPMPTPAPTPRPTVPPTTAMRPAADSNLVIIILDTSATRLKNETVQAKMLLYYNIDGSLNSAKTGKPFDNGLVVTVAVDEAQMRESSVKRCLEVTILDKDESSQEKNYVLFPDWGSEHEFALEGPFHDASLMRSALAYNLSRAMDKFWAPRTMFAELYVQEMGERYLEFDKNYQGVYLFRETVKRDGHRVDIKRQDPLDPPGKGGFLLSLKHYNIDDSYWKLNWGGNVDIEYPPSSQKTPAMKDFIRDFLAKFEATLFGPDWIGDYRQLTGVPSFVDYFLLTELMGSADAYLYNAYFNYDPTSNGTGKLHAGPIFSFEFSMGNVGPYVDKFPEWDGGSDSPAGWRYEMRIKNRQGSDMSQWFGRLLGDPAFKGEVINRWLQVRAAEFSDVSILMQIDRFATELRAVNASARNDAMRPSGMSFEDGVKSLKNWMAARTKWMDDHLSASQYMFHTGVSVNSLCTETPKSRGPGVIGRRLLARNCPLECVGPWPNNPDCKSNMDWLAAHWQGDPKYAAGGVDGTTCSFQKYINKETPTKCPDPCWDDPVRDANGCDTQCTGPWLYYPKCASNVNWLMANWRSNPRYAAGGVDGTRCSCQKFIRGETPGLCPAVCKPGCDTGDCVPPDDGTFPGCSNAMQWVALNWEGDTKFKSGGVNGTSCSIQKFINWENATICPPPCQTGPAPTPVMPPTTVIPPTIEQTPEPTSVAAPPPTGYPTVSPPTFAVEIELTCQGTCYGPYPGAPYCKENIDLIVANFDPLVYPTLDPANLCSIQAYLATQDFCPPVPSGLRCVSELSLCTTTPTAPTNSRPTPKAPTAATKVTQQDEDSITGGGVGTVFAVLVPVLCVLAGVLAWYYYRRRIQNQWKRVHLQDSDQEPVLLPYTQQL